MRISASKDDPGYVNYRGPCRVFLDGVEQKHVLACDEEAGYIEAYLTNEDGGPRVVGDSVAKETRRGVVRTEPIRAASPCPTP